MKNCNAKRIKNEAKLSTKAEELVSYPAYIGLDTHSQTIAVAVARSGREEPEFRREIANKPKSVAKLIKQLNTEFGGEVLLFCYEAGPCGYALHRQILESGHECQVIAPSMIPNRPGDRIKNRSTRRM